MALEWISPREWLNALEGVHLILIVEILLLLVSYVYFVVKAARLEYIGGLFGRHRIRVLGIVLGFLTVGYVLYVLAKIEPNQWVAIFLTAGLLAATAVYALATINLADKTTKMAREMREQTIVSSSATVLAKGIGEYEKQRRANVTSTGQDYFLYFEIYNAGKGPAIELRIFLMKGKNKKDALPDPHRETFLSAGETIDFLGGPNAEPNVSKLDERGTYFVACEYQTILSLDSKKWQRTWLPFTVLKELNGLEAESSKVWVIPQKSERERDVDEKDLIEWPEEHKIG
ncbi:MAG: hypothetical protein HY667_03285 [Chloroflexi bacterium]|nr:hypothetical protein [Chloroflexota bacterium]